MKKPTPFLASSSFFFFLLSAFTSTKAEIVYDSDGKPLRNAGQYYLLPRFPIGGPVITTATIIDEQSGRCFLAVVQVSSSMHSATYPTVIGTPLIVPFISTENRLRISFAKLNITKCTDSPNWVVTNSIPIGQPVMLGDAREFPEAIVNGWFYIKPAVDRGKKYYQFVFCDRTDACGDIGVRTDTYGNNRLVVTNKIPLLFEFGKVNN